MYNLGKIGYNGGGDREGGHRDVVPGHSPQEGVSSLCGGPLYLVWVCVAYSGVWGGSMADFDANDIIRISARMKWDDAYDIVTCIDMLEHVPRKIRRKIIGEIVRVASKAVFLVAPVDSEENYRAEQLVLKYTKNQFIKEHQSYGLVNFEEIESVLRDHQRNKKIKYYQRNEIDDLLNWVTMMIQNRVSKYKIYKEAYFLENQFCPRRIALSIYL